MLQAPEKLSPRVAQAHDDTANTLLVSVASLWEMQIKHALGKLELDIPLAQIVREQLQGGGFELRMLWPRRAKSSTIGLRLH